MYVVTRAPNFTEYKENDSMLRSFWQGTHSLFEGTNVMETFTCLFQATSGDSIGGVLMKKMNKTTQVTQKSERENAMTTEKHIQRCPPTSKYGKDDI